MPHVLDPLQELTNLADKTTVPLMRALLDVGRASVRFGVLGVPQVRVNEDSQAFRDLADLLRRTTILSSLFGAKRVLLEAEDARSKEPRKFRAYQAIHPVIPEVPLEEAAQDFISREPRLADGFREVSRIVDEERGFALARSTSLKLTERIQRSLTNALRTGVTISQWETIADEITDWTRAYANTVFSTSLNTMYTDGRMREARRPAIQAVLPGFRYDAIGDRNTRDNHMALDGFLARTDDPIWVTIRTPNGWG